MLTVYHGSTTEVSRPLAKIGRPNLDFGPGFYVTTLREQAVSWAQNICRRFPGKSPVLNTYELDMDCIHTSGYKLLRFEAYDETWLDFIAASRKGLQPWLTYDLIAGGIANDRVFDAVEAYLDGLATKEKALGLLVYQMPNDQICLLNQQLIDECLHFIESQYVHKQEGGKKR